MAKKTLEYGKKWGDFLRRGGLAASALGLLMLIAKVNSSIAFYFIFGGAASWLGSKAIESK